MAATLPKGEKMKRVIKWISSRLEDVESKGLFQLIQAASREFNLSPKEEEFLMSFYKKERLE
jgi:hypothetical protein